ncbi:hypothetical protein [Emticicia fontis]
MTEEKRKSSQKKSYKQHTVKIPVTQIASEKVDTTVTTFLSEGLYGLKMIQRNDHSGRTEKIAFMVGTFLKTDSKSYQSIRMMSREIRLIFIHQFSIRYSQLFP